LLHTHFVPREIVVHHPFGGVKVEPFGGDIGGDEYPWCMRFHPSQPALLRAEEGKDALSGHPGIAHAGAAPRAPGERHVPQATPKVLDCRREVDEDKRSFAVLENGAQALDLRVRRTALLARQSQ
jgi:hypothetical protein